MRFSRALCVAAVAAANLVTPHALAAPAYTFHTFVISEVFSNTDGTVQFIELREASNFNSQGSWLGLSITATNDDGSIFNTFTFPSNLPNAITSGKRVLLATAGFESLAGGVVPNFTIPANFIPLTAGGANINFAGLIGGADITFTSLPTNGTSSLNYPGGTIAQNSPTNFAGVSGSVNVAPPASGACCNSTTCTVGTSAACTTGGGAYQGNNSACGPVGNPTTCCPVNFNQAGGVTVQDIFDFLGAYFTGQPAADFNHVGGVTVQDIFDFLGAYFAGC